VNFAARLAIALALVAAPAGAIDLTGTWEGTFSCKSFDGTAAPQNFKNKDSVMLIAQTDATFIAQLDEVDHYNGAVIDDASDTTARGEAVMNHCGTDALPLLDSPGEIVRLKAKVDPEKGTGTLSGDSIFEMPGLVMSCKFKFKRTNLTPNKFGGCPV